MKDFLVDMLLYSTLENMVIYGYFLAVNKIKIEWKRDLALILVLSLISAIGCRIINPLIWQFVGIIVYSIVLSSSHKAKLLKTLYKCTQGMVLLLAIDTLVFLVAYRNLIGIDFTSLNLYTKFLLSIPPRAIELGMIYLFVGGNGMRKYLWFGKPQKKTERKFK